MIGTRFYPMAMVVNNVMAKELEDNKGKTWRDSKCPPQGQASPVHNVVESLIEYYQATPVEIEVCE